MSLNGNDGLGAAEQQQSVHSPIFRFLSAKQFLQLSRIEARQKLSVTPQPHHVSSGEGLAFVFVSHRWCEPNNPDPDGSQLAAVQKLLRYVQVVLQALISNHAAVLEPEWPCDLQDMLEGMPQAAALVSRMDVKTCPQEWLDDVMEHIYIWYDCLCLPQKVPSRCPVECQEFGMALRNLDQLAQQCEVVCLESEDYMERAWCAFEYYQRSLAQYDGHIHVDCDKILRGSQVDWGLYENDASQPETKEEENVMNSADAAAASSAEMLQQLIEEADGHVETQLRAIEQWQSKDNNDRCVRESIVKRVVLRAQHSRFEEIQSQWQKFRRKGQHLLETEDKKEESKCSDCHLPDLARERIRIHNGKFTSLPPSPPLTQAMTHLIREMFAALFHFSCRDAAALARPPVVVPPNLNACVPNVGVQCGLHDHEGPNKRPLAEQREALLQCIEAGHKTLQFGALQCPQGHRLQPSVTSVSLNCDGATCCDKRKEGQQQDVDIEPGHPTASCVTCDFDMCFFCATRGSRSHDKNSAATTLQQKWDTLVHACNATAVIKSGESNGIALCERRITIDLIDLAHNVLSKFGLKCTNNGDVAFVGLLALRNILSKKDRGNDSARVAGGPLGPLVAVFQSMLPSTLPKNRNNENGPDDINISAGALCHIFPLVRDAVLLYSNILASGTTLTSLVVTVSLSVPRWVLLDMASGKLDTNTALTIDGCLNLGKKVQRYLIEHPECFSYSFDTNESPLRHVFCEFEQSCVGGWAPCKHKNKTSLMAGALSGKSASSILDPWASSTFPTPLANFVTLRNRDRVYVIGGATGEEDPATGVYTSCTSDVYSTQLPVSRDTVWSNVGVLGVARRCHMGCVQTDVEGNAIRLLVGGGRGSTVPGEESEMLTSVEAWTFAEDENGRTRWEPFLQLPRPRVNGHMVFFENCLFVFGGRSERNLSAPDPGSRICDIYGFRTNKWVGGPEHPRAFTAGGLILFTRFLWVFGGSTGGMNSLKGSFVLDLKPWTDWVSQGCLADQRPKSGWTEGPALPAGMSSPNICFASCEDTGLQNDWVLSVGSLAIGNHCFGLQLPDRGWYEADEFRWSDQGLRARKGNFPRRTLVYRMEWKLLGAAPDAIATGGVFAAHGVLSMIGGLSAMKERTCDSVHFRPLPIPALPLNPHVISGFGFGGLLSLLLQSNQSPGLQKIRLNDSYPMGRLGFPMEEMALFSSDGSKKFTIKSAKDMLCQRCLLRTQSVEAARAHNDTCLYALVAGPQTASGRKTQSIFLCSECLCDLYFNKRQKMALDSSIARTTDVFH